MEKNLHITFNSMEKKVMPKAYYPGGQLTSYTVGVAKTRQTDVSFRYCHKMVAAIT